MGDMATLQARLEKSVVKLVCEQPCKKDPVIILTGIPIVSEEDYCYIITSTNIFCRKDITKRKVVFPDPERTSVDIMEENVKIEGQLAAISINVPSKLVDTVTFSSKMVSNDEVIYMIGFIPPESMGSHFDHGRVTLAETKYSKNHFNHDCPPYLSTSGGEPVFNDALQMVGMSCKNRGVTCAMNVDCITREISRFHEGMEEKGLQEILEFIKQNKMKCWNKGRQYEYHDRSAKRSGSVWSEGRQQEYHDRSAKRRGMQP